MTDRPRLLVLTDIGADPDDQQSLVRLLVHANEFDIEGILCEHWADHPISPDEQMDLVERVLAAYGEVQGNLARHAPGFPTAAELRGGAKRGASHVPFALDEDAGTAADLVGPGRDTAASEWIIQVADQSDTRPLNIAVWGGTADLAQALWKVREKRSPSEASAFVSRLRVHAISDQDATGPWIRENFPGLFYILDHSRDGDKMHSCYRGMFLGGDESLTSREWITANVRKGHGPLGELYPLETWTGPNPHGCLKEGDTPSWFYFLPYGLSVPERPDYGGWGGRFEPNGSFYQDAEDTVEDVTSSPATVWRWRDAYQREFAARMDWCVESPEEASHPPTAVLNGDGTAAPVIVTCKPGEVVQLSARGSRSGRSGPVSFHWWIYHEAGACDAEVTVSAADSETAEVQIPRDAAGCEVHVILEVTGPGSPPMTRYRRAILRMR